mmetsp:Transcript_114915/g.263851  ORF Transcript_114915/g.263851 Transcript_114915/m.263851 type:complete len:313 (+) Transcript_114915:231-1169(+)
MSAPPDLATQLGNQPIPPSGSSKSATPSSTAKSELHAIVLPPETERLPTALLLSRDILLPAFVRWEADPCAVAPVANELAGPLANEATLLLEASVCSGTVDACSSSVLTRQWRSGPPASWNASASGIRGSRRDLSSSMRPSRIMPLTSWVPLGRIGLARKSNWLRVVGSRNNHANLRAPSAEIWFPIKRKCNRGRVSAADRPNPSPNCPSVSPVSLFCPKSRSRLASWEQRPIPSPNCPKVASVIWFLAKFRSRLLSLTHFPIPSPNFPRASPVITLPRKFIAILVNAAQSPTPIPNWPRDASVIRLYDRSR